MFQPPDGGSGGSGGSGGVATLAQRANRIVRGSQNINLSNKDFLLHVETDLGDHVYQKLMAYAAELHVLGVIAGVIDGPRDKYLAAIKKSAGDYFTQLLARSKKTSWVDDWNPMNMGANVLGWYYKAWGLIPGRMGREWDRDGNVLLSTDWDKALDNAISDYIGNICSSCKARWDEFWKDYDEKGLLVAYGKLRIDAEFLAAEVAITVALAAATEGVAAGIRIVGSRIAAEVTEVVVRSLSVASKGTPESGVLIQTAIKDAEINPGIIKEIFNEEKLGLGSDRPSVGARAEKPVDPVKKPAGAAAARLSNKAIGDAAEGQAQKDLAAQGYTEQMSVTNKSGNGIDRAGRNPTTGDVKVLEVKANGAGLNELQAAGGPANTSRVITTARESNLPTWADAQENAETLDEWLKDAPKKSYDIWKYDVDPETGEVTNPRTTSWEWTKKPNRLNFRDGLTPSSPSAPLPGEGANPPTGPPVP